MLLTYLLNLLHTSLCHTIDKFLGQQITIESRSFGTVGLAVRCRTWRCRPELTPLRLQFRSVTKPVYS